MVEDKRGPNESPTESLVAGCLWGLQKVMGKTLHLMLKPEYGLHFYGTL
ncbi:MAG: hypothetical protein IJU79_07505 [Desulfovibrionaceae bacterium]|nr:hypothetical protein [Desulfovibrionaceae bacterium]